ncbi:MAG: 50S ribosomal protein L25/general stress protein Ctc [Halanaerobiaceae bacterium]|nr:50S ribosomal protein L25/general stress protein Ctc [Halanaerobiaceae bacterium]
MEKYHLKVEKREATGKGAARKLRASGLVPGVVYGKNIEAKPVIVNPQDLANKFSSNIIFDLEIAGEDKLTAMIKEVKKDPITGVIEHIDFLHITMDEKIVVTVPLVLVGDAPGVKAGGVLQQLLREIEVQCLPLDIPENIEVDISGLEIGSSISVSDIETGDKLEVVTAPEEVIATVTVPADITEEETGEGEEESAEPEVIGEEAEEAAEE